MYSCIWDVGGTDHIIYTGQQRATIDLRPATLRNEPGGGGFLSTVDGSYGGFTIAGDFRNVLADVGTDTGVIIENASGGTNSDVITGNAAANRLSGNGGGDYLYGLDGNDTLDGGFGDDLMAGGEGSDIYIVDSWQDVVNETTINDAGYWRDIGSIGDEIRTPLSTYTLSNDSWSVVENLTFIGPDTLGFTGRGNDAVNRIFGSNAGSFLFGNGGDDYLYGLDGNDELDGGTHDDFMSGGRGNDVYFVDSAGDEVSETGNDENDIVFDMGGADEVRTSLSIYTLSNDPASVVENLTYTGTGGFWGIGNQAPNRITGGGDADILDGGEGGDTLIGGAGNDTLIAGTGVNFVDGGSGDDTISVVRQAGDVVTGGPDSDTLRFGDADAGVTVDITTGFARFYDGAVRVGSVAFWDIENLTGSRFADTLTGDASNNRLSGLGGPDTLRGGRGNDRLTGGTGNDTFVFASGWDHDTITDFAVGQDRLDMTGVSGLTSMSQLAITNTALGARIAYGSDSITLTGVTASQLTAASFQFAAPPAGQTFDGTARWGTTITGTAGVDTVSYASANHAIFVDLVRTGTNVEGLGAGKTGTLVAVENVTGSANSLNYLHGNQANNVLVGGSASDWLNGRGGSNTLDGRGGVDYADYYEMGGAVSIDLAVGRATHGTGTDTLISVEQFRGTYFADTFNGDGVDNYFLGMSGNDVIRGNGGADWLEGSDGADTIDGGLGTDRIVGGYGNDVLTGGTHADRFLFGGSDLGQDRITDFRYVDGDRIDFSAHASVNSLANLTIASSAAGAIISYATTGGASSIVLDGIAAATITQDWFVF
jgi:Ca2+-binding RTX toxin-like protein